MEKAFSKKINNRKEYAKTLLFILVICLLCVGTILISAGTADAQINTSRVEKRCETLESRISDIQAKLHSETNITRIEQEAMELGMVYPTFRETVNLVAGEKEGTDLASAIKTVAYENR